jgi:hypothetical protein
VSGASQLFVQPSHLDIPASSQPGVWTRGIPAPGAVRPFGTGSDVPAVDGLATCRDLASLSPPTVLEAYEIYAMTIGWSVYFSGSAAGDATLSFLVSLLVNDRPAYTKTDIVAAHSVGVGSDYAISGTLADDLVNPVRIGARDRLGLEVGFRSSISGSAFTPQRLFVGVQQILQGASSFALVPVESTISYRVIDLPGNRVL